VNLVSEATNFVKLLAVPFNAYGAAVLIFACALIALFVKKVSMEVLFSLLVIGFVPWFAWNTVFVFDYPAGRNAGNFEIAGFVYSTPTDLFLSRRADIANKAAPERNSALLSNAGGDSSEVWTAGSLTASRLFGFLSTCLFAVGLIGVFAKKIPSFAAAWRQSGQTHDPKGGGPT
jgi:hypothetical protein